MSLEYDIVDPTTGASGTFTAFKCDEEHSLFIENPPDLAIRQFFSWTQRGIVEVFGGQKGRMIMVDCWIHDSTFTTLPLLDTYLASLDTLAGNLMNVRLTSGSSQITRNNCRFIGCKRKPFPGQERAEPLIVQGVSKTNYGNWHIAGELHFYQLII